MNLPLLKFLFLRAHLALRRLGWGNVAAILLMLVALAASLGPVLYARHALAAQQRTLDHARMQLRTLDRKEGSVPMLSTNDERLAAFYAALGQYRYAEQQVKTLFAIATKTGLTLDQAEYRSAADKQGRFYTYQVNFPVKGSYPAIRRFCEQVLLAVPFASLDQMSFKRDAIGANVVEAKLHVTLYLDDGGPQGAPNALVRAGGGEKVE
jgi:hypothetical protein